jgi:hypothetical protein
MLRKLALVLVAGGTIAAGTALAPTEASAWYRCWRCGPYAYYGGPIVYYPRVYRWRRPIYRWRRPVVIYRGYPAYYRPYWRWRRWW